jgi:uncharacterized protein YceK
MKSLKIIYFILFVLIICSSCGTLGVITVENQRNTFSSSKNEYLNRFNSYEDYAKYELCRRTPNIYGGTVYTFREIYDPCTHGETAAALSRIFLPVTMIDLPLCVIADTIALPYTIYKQGKYGYVYDERPWSCKKCYKQPFEAIISGHYKGNIKIKFFEDNKEHEIFCKLYGLDIPTDDQLHNRVYDFLSNNKLYSKPVNVEPFGRLSFSETPSPKNNSGIIGIIKVSGDKSIQSMLLSENLAKIDEEKCKKPVCDEWRKIEEQAKPKKSRNNFYDKYENAPVPAQPVSPEKKFKY